MQNQKLGHKNMKHYCNKRINHQLYVLRRNNMIRKAYDILSKAAMTEKASKIAMEKLKEMEELIEKDEVELKGSGHKESNEALNDDNISDDNESGCEVDETPVLDPPCAKTKGMSNARWKSSVEKRNKNASKNKVSSSKKGDAAKQQKQKQSEDPVLSSKCNIEKQKNRASKDPVSFSKKVLNSYSSCHAQSNSNSSNPSPLTMSTRFLPPPIQVSSLHIPYDSNYDSMALVMPNSSFTSMLLSQHTSASTYAPNHQFGSYPQPSQDMDSLTEEQQHGSKHRPYYLPWVNSEDMEETTDCKFYVLEAN
ncbi:hypothetical protein ACLB2K_067562 [Fragaria x ananassa]